MQQFWAKNFKFQKHPPFLFPRQRRPYWTNRSRFYCINQLHLMQGVIPPSFIKICWAGNEKNEVEVFQTFTVSMATVAILKFVSWHCTPYHAGWHSCEVSLTWVHPPSRNVSDKRRVKKNNNNLEILCWDANTKVAQTPCLPMGLLLQYSYASKDIFLWSSIKFQSISVEIYALKADWSIQVSMVTQNFSDPRNIEFASSHQKTYSYEIP